MWDEFDQETSESELVPVPSCHGSVPNRYAAKAPCSAITIAIRNNSLAHFSRAAPGQFSQALKQLRGERSAGMARGCVPPDAAASPRTRSSDRAAATSASWIRRPVDKPRSARSAPRRPAAYDPARLDRPRPRHGAARANPTPPPSWRSGRADGRSAIRSTRSALWVVRPRHATAGRPRAPMQSSMPWAGSTRSTVRTKAA